MEGKQMVAIIDLTIGKEEALLNSPGSSLIRSKTKPLCEHRFPPDCRRLIMARANRYPAGK
jgi:hypothetical protein